MLVPAMLQPLPVPPPLRQVQVVQHVGVGDEQRMQGQEVHQVAKLQGRGGGCWGQWASHTQGCACACVHVRVCVCVHVCACGRGGGAVGLAVGVAGVAVCSRGQEGEDCKPYKAATTVNGSRSIGMGGWE